MLLLQTRILDVAIATIQHLIKIIELVKTYFLKKIIAIITWYY